MTFIVGDCTMEMGRFPDGHFDLIVADPPYGGVVKNKWDEHGQAYHLNVASGHWRKGFWADEVYPYIVRTDFGATRQASTHPFYLVRAKSVDLP